MAIRNCLKCKDREAAGQARGVWRIVTIRKGDPANHSVQLRLPRATREGVSYFAETACGYQTTFEEQTR